MENGWYSWNNCKKKIAKQCGSISKACSRGVEQQKMENKYNSLKDKAWKVYQGGWHTTGTKQQRGE
jgi:hypothetical protein